MENPSNTSKLLYKCDKCKQSFPKIDSLKIHIRTNHKSNKPYECETCESKFDDLIHFNAHKRIHLGLKPYKCDFCEIAFDEIGNLSKHRLRVHSIIRKGKDVKFNCDVCGNSYKNKYTLLQHKRDHTGESPYKCDICGLRFARKGALQTHKRMHTKKPFMCEICKLLFDDMERLTRHAYLHTCGICDKALNAKLKIYYCNHTEERGVESSLKFECFNFKIKEEEPLDIYDEIE